MNFLHQLKHNIRLCVQIAFTALTNGYVLGFTKGKIYQGASKQLCVPGLNCYSCPGAVASCPIGSLQAVIGSRNFRFSFYVIGFLMIVGSLAGRFVCGWLCPFGLVQELLHKIPFVRKVRALPFDKYLRWLKYIVLAIFVFALPMFLTGTAGYGTPWYCKLICPSGTLLAGIPLVSANPLLRSAAGFLFSWKVGILVLILLLSVFTYRPFCKYLCPLGAIYGIFNRFSLYRYEIDGEKCNKCGMCAKNCEMNIKVYENPNSPECIRCGKCLHICPKSAIHTTFSKKSE